MESYHAGLAGKPVAIGSGRTADGTINDLAVRYYGSSDFRQLAKVTQSTYRNILERFRSVHGGKPAALLKREHVLRFVDEKAGTPAAANGLLKMLRILMRFAVDRGMRLDDPTAGVRKVRYASPGFRQWAEEDIDAYCQHWPTGTRQRLAMCLMLYTGQRPGDVSRMGRQHLQGTSLTLTQQKTGTRLSVPLHQDLLVELAAVPGGQLIFLQTMHGKPFSPAGFGNWFGDSVQAAGIINGCTAHGLRKAAARRLAEAGCTAHQIAAITGHKSLRETERYTRAADQIRLAETAMASISKAHSTKK